MKRLSSSSSPLLLIHMVHALVVLLLLISITTTEGAISDRPITTAQSTTTGSIRINREEEAEEIKIMTSTSEELESKSSASNNGAGYADNTGADNNNYGYEINKELDDMPLLPITSDETVRACRMLNINPSHDIFICSYPKSGTTWTQNIVVRLLWEITFNLKNKKGQEEEEEEDFSNLPDDWHLSYSAPFYEADQYWKHSSTRTSSTTTTIDNKEDNNSIVYERLPVKIPIIAKKETEYRVFNTHLRPNQLPNNSKCIYIIRHPLDVMISFYYHLSNQTVDDGGYTGTLTEFCNDFRNGTIVYGKWQDHIEAWLGTGTRSTSSNTTKNNKKNFLLLHYEDMKTNLEKETKRIANFLLDIDDDDNDDDNDDSNLNELITQRVVPHCTFQSMKKDKLKYTPLSVGWKINPKTNKKYNEFVRSGNIGDGKQECPIEIQNKWCQQDVPIAKIRWNNANVNKDQISNRYL